MDSTKIKEARENWKTLEAELSAAEEKLKSIRLSWETAKTDLTSAKTRLAAAENHIEEVLDGIAQGAAGPGDLKNARMAVKDIQDEISDLEAVVLAHKPVEARAKIEVDDLRNRLRLEKQMLWMGVAEQIEEKARKTIGDILRQALAARELSGVYMPDGAGDHLSRIFFANSRPQLEAEKTMLVEKHLK